MVRRSFPDLELTEAAALGTSTGLAAGTSLLYVNDTLQAQRVKTSTQYALPNGCKQGAFFHFQEWKKTWAGQGGYDEGREGVQPLTSLVERGRYSARPVNFTISPEGIHVLK